MIYTIIQEAAELLKDGIDLITEADAALTNLLSYPLHATLSRSVKQYTGLNLWTCGSYFIPYNLHMAGNVVILVDCYDELFVVLGQLH